MHKTALAGVLALAMTVAVFPASAGEFASNSGTGSHAALVISDSHIARLKSMLRLTPAQERHWPAAEAALRNFARQQARSDNGGGLVERVKSQASAVAGQAVALKRVLAAAGPLIRALDEDQKRDAVALARSLGFERLAAAL